MGALGRRVEWPSRIAGQGIANALTRGRDCVRVYDENGMILFVCPTFPGDLVIGYTASTLAIKRGDYVLTFGDQGQIRGVTRTQITARG